MILYENKPTDSTPELTKDLAMEIYSKLKEAKPSEVFSNPANESKYYWKHIQLVLQEIKQLENLFNRYMSGSELLEPEVSHINENGEKIIDSPAVYYKPTTKADLISQFETDYLDVETVLNDFMNGQTWTSFKKSYEVI